MSNFIAKNKIVFIGMFSMITAFAILHPTIVIDREILIDESMVYGVNWPTASNAVLVVSHLHHVVYDNGIVSAVFVGLLFWFYSKTLFASDFELFGKGKPKIRSMTLLFSALLSFALILGESFRVFGDFDFLAASGIQVFISIVLMLGYTPLFYTLSELSIKFFDSVALRIESKRQKLNNVKFTILFDRHPFLAPFGFLLLAWLPIWIINFPGGLQFDTTTQLMQYFGIWRHSDHHPITSTLVFGFIAHIGRFINSNNFNASMFLMILFQQLITAAACAYSLMVIKQWSVNRRIRLVVLLFWALFPWIPFFLAQANAKDVPSMALLLIFFTLYLDIVRCARLNIVFKKQLVLLVIIGITASLFRHVNVYIVVLSIMPLFLMKNQIKLRAAFVVAGIICLAGVSAITSTMRNITGSERISTAAIFTIPFQQTARFVRDHPNEVTPEERLAIDAVLRFDGLGETYVPYAADNVFNAFRGREGLPEYFRHWFRMGLRRPATYLAATIAGSSWYYLPAKGMPTFIHGFDYFQHHTGAGIQDRFFDQAENDINFLFSSETKLATRGFFWGTLRLPGVSMLYQFATYTWAFLFLGLYLIRKNKKEYLFGLIPVALFILTCVASPGNHAHRYFMSVVMMIPVLAAWALYASRDFNLKTVSTKKTDS